MSGDRRLLTAERLAGIRRLSDTRTYFHERHYGSPTDEMLAMRDLLAHIDALAAENAELRALVERAEARIGNARRWRAAAKHLHGQRAFHRTMQKWAAESIHDYEAKLVALRAAASVMVAANPTAEGARELAALVLGGEET